MHDRDWSLSARRCAGPQCVKREKGLTDEVVASGNWEDDLGGQAAGGAEALQAEHLNNRIADKSKWKNVNFSASRCVKLLRAYGGCLGAKCR